MHFLRFIFYMGPLLFGVGFLAPLISQSFQSLGWNAPTGLSTLTFGLIVGAALGALATFRGRWV